MRRFLLILLVLGISACSGAATPPGQFVGGPSPVATLSFPGSAPGTGATSAVGATQPAYPPPGVSTPLPGSTPGTVAAWAGLGLQGSLILILHSASGVDVARMDLTSGEIRPIYHAPDQALVGTALVSPDGKQILLQYAPPATASSQVSYTSLYLLPADGSAPPQSLLPALRGNEAYFAPVWAPDGKSVYASHFVQGSADGSSPDQYTIEQVDLAGKAHLVLQNAMWPSLSPDGARLSYVSALGSTGQNDLYLADADGKNITAPLSPGTFLAVDDHFFTPDGKAIIFSAVNPTSPTPAPTFWEKLLGIHVVSAHNIPSDWYRIPLEGGTPTRLTELNDTGMYACLSPDGQRVAFIAQSGIYVMGLDGSQLTQLSQLAATGTVDWVK